MKDFNEAKTKSRMRGYIKKAWLWAVIIALSVGFWGVMFYWAAQPSAEEKFEIWVGAPANLKTEIIGEIKAVCADDNMKKCAVSNYNPADTYYGAAFGLRSTAVDIFILAKEQADQIAASGIFGELTGKYADYADGYTYADVPLGVKFIGEYYIFVNSETNKDERLISAVMDILISHREDQ